MAVGAALVNTIKLGFALLQKELTFRQQLKHKVEKSDIENYMKLEEAKFKVEYKKLIENTTIEDVLAITNVLKVLRESYNAHRVMIVTFHNGIAVHFRNYSIRYEETRPQIKPIINDYQSKPLSPYYSLIKKFNTNSLVIIDIDNSKNSDLPKHTLEALKSLGKRYIVAAPLLVMEGDNIQTQQKVIKINKEGENYFLLGVIIMSLDKESDPSIDTNLYNLRTEILMKTDDIINIYQKNNSVLV